MDDCREEVAPWLTDVDLEAPAGEENVVRCAGILKDGSRCTRTYASSKAPKVSYCLKHQAQMHTSTHGYAPLSQSDIQVKEPRSAKTRRCCQVHWAYQMVCGFFSLFVAIGLLFMSIVLKIPHLGLASVVFFCIPMVLLAQCMCRMALIILLPQPSVYTQCA
ncbi:hypothetical protein Ae201684P_016138 [Aphanomyces euteiches]|nr:hypothetical protein Ae201684P_016138 [Aphanomyces euteiches]